MSQAKKSFVLIVFLFCMIIVSAIIFSFLSFAVSKLKTTKYMLQSPPAFYAADSGAERLLYKLLIEKKPLTTIETNTLENNATYTLIPKTPKRFISQGKYQNAIRTIEIFYP